MVIYKSTKYNKYIEDFPKSQIYSKISSLYQQIDKINYEYKDFLESELVRTIYFLLRRRKPRIYDKNQSTIKHF